MNDKPANEADRTELCFATLNQIVKEIQRRFSASVIAIEEEGRQAITVVHGPAHARFGLIEMARQYSQSQLAQDMMPFDPENHD